MIDGHYFEETEWSKTQSSLTGLARAARELCVFEKLKQDDTVSCFFDLLEAASKEDRAKARVLQCKFAARLYDHHEANWTKYLTRTVLDMDTCCTYFANRDHEIPRLMLDAAMRELFALSQIAMLSSDNLQAGSDLPVWTVEKVDLQAAFLDRLMHISIRGSGIYARYNFFRVRIDDGRMQIVPVAHPDPVTFDQLIGYEDQHEQVVSNTIFLLEGNPASNMLLYGDAGAGKSATVKATVNALAIKGLRLIEIDKTQLAYLPELLDELAENPLKFIVFVDDLSFQENEDGFAALKAVLEGSVSSRSSNVVVYATSNRRHLVREMNKDETDLHLNDSTQEVMSLSERFGLRVLFEKPNIEQYRTIVLELAHQAGLKQSDEQISAAAECFALHRTGRSARAARQLVDQLLAAQLMEERDADA